MPIFEQICTLPASAENAFAYLAHPAAFGRLNPPWEKVRIISHSGGIENGAQLHMQVQMAPGVWLPWVARHEGYQANVQFQDRQIRGPFAQWLHTHRVTPVTLTTCTLQDYIEYRLPFSLFSQWWAIPTIITPKLTKMFDYRHAIMQLDLTVMELQPIPADVPALWLAEDLPNRDQWQAFFSITGWPLHNQGLTTANPTGKAPEVLVLSDKEYPATNSGQAIDRPNTIHGVPVARYFTLDDVATGQFEETFSTRADESLMTGTDAKLQAPKLKTQIQALDYAWPLLKTMYDYRAFLFRTYASKD
jgi:ligand-binding SRPBCC domain-containing protein